MVLLIIAVLGAGRKYRFSVTVDDINLLKSEADWQKKDENVEDWANVSSVWRAFIIKVE